VVRHCRWTLRHLGRFSGRDGQHPTGRFIEHFCGWLFRLQILLTSLALVGCRSSLPQSQGVSICCLTRFLYRAKNVRKPMIKQHSRLCDVIRSGRNSYKLPFFHTHRSCRGRHSPPPDVGTWPAEHANDVWVTYLKRRRNFCVCNGCVETILEFSVLLVFLVPGYTYMYWHHLTTVSLVCHPFSPKVRCS
jgi:hypothetical protein